MSLIDQLRASRPDLEELKDLTDSDLVSMYSQVTGASLDLSAMDLGLDPQDYIQNKSRGEDLVNQGILGLGDIVGGVAGFLDIPVAGATGYAPLSSAVDWAADATGLSDYGRRLELTMSPQSQQTNAAWDKTWNDEEMGAWDKAKNLAGVVWDDPAYALEFAARSAPTLIPAFGAAKLLGMGAKAMEAAGLTRTAAAARPLIPGMAEGGVAAGYQMNNLLGEDVDPREAAGYSALTGIGTGLIGGVTGALGARAGLTDPHRLIAGYRLPGEAPALPYYKRIPGGMALETGQEALQSPWEQAMTNVATGEEWDQGLARSAVEGAIGGGIIGAPFNVFRGREVDLLKTQDAPEAEPLDPTKGLDTTRFNAPSDVPSIRNQVGLNTAEGLSNWAGVQEPGGTSGYAGALAASYNEPSGHRVADKLTGVERELSTGDWLYYQATGQLPPTTDPAKVEGKPKPIEGAAPELQRLLDVARNLPIAADPTKVKPGEVTANGHNQKGKPSTKAIEWATTLSGLKTVDEVDKAVEKGTRSTAGYWQWVMPMALARIQEINAEQAQTLAQQAKQNDTVDGPGVPVTPTIAQNAQPTEGVAPPTPTTSSVAQDEVDEEFAREMPPITPEQHDRAIANGIRSTSDLDIAHRIGELDVPTPPPSPITSEIPTNALSGQTTPQAGQETRTTAPDATTEPGVTEAPKVPKTQQKIIVDENVLGWQNAFNAAVDRVAGVRNLSDKAKTTFSELMQRYYQVGRFSTYAGVKPPSYDAMAARLRRDGHEVSHTQVSKYISDFQDGYAAAMGQEGQPVTFEKPDENTWGYALDDGNYLGKRDIGATAASEDYVDLQDSRANDTEVDIAPDGEAALPEQAAPVNQFGEMADDATIDDELGYQTGSVGGVNEFVSGGRGGAEGVSARPRVVKYFAKRHLFATNQARAARGESPLTEAEAKAELGKLSDEVLGRYLDRLRKATVSDARLADPKDAKPKLTAAYQGLQDDMAALGAGALRATKNNRVVEELEEPDTSAATPGAVVAWQQATQSIPNAPALGTLSVDLAGMWEEAYNESIDLPDVHRAPALRKIARRLISEQNTRPARRDTAGATAQPQAGDTTQTGSGQDMAGSVPESGDAQPELAGRGSAAPEPDIVIGAKDASNVAITTRKKRRVAPPAEPQVQQGLGEGVAENPTTEQALRDTIASLLGKGHNWRIHVYATPEAARAASRAKSEAGNAYGWAESDQEIGNAYGWVESDQNGVKHAYFIANRIEAGTELGKFLHEVGAHIGLENVLSPALYQNLVGQLRKWVALNNDSLESRLAKAALARVEYAQAESTRAGREGLDQVEQDSELVAYFLEEAIKAGIDPTATKANSPLGTWFLRLWTAFKRALRKLRIENLDQLQPQHVVDLAYGAARLELNTYWHGTAASFRKFNHDYMGSGEGAKVQYGIAAPSHITAAKEAVHNVLSDTYTGTNRGLLGWMGINNIAERFGETLPILKSIEKTFNEMSHQAKLWLDRGDQIERLWSMLTPKQTELVSFIAGNATILQFDPSKDQANTPEKQEVAQKWKELQALDGANPKVKGTTTLLAAVQHYRDVHKESLAYLEGVLKQAQAAGASTHAIESVRDTIKALRKKQTHFWLPLHRFGDFHSVAMSPTLFALHQRHQQHLNDVHANKANPAAWSKADDKLFRQLRKDPKHYESMGHESERAARRRATHWQGKGWQATSNVNRYTSDMARVHLKPEIEAFEKMLAHTKLDAKVANKLVDSYTDLLIEALPENHILKRQLDREGIAGWDPDMKRAFAKTAQSQAFAMSRLLHARKLGEQLGQLERQGDSFQPHATLARDLHAELIKQQELAMTRSEDPYWVRFATGFNYMSMLGGSPFFWALQLAQVPTITLPYLIGRNNANVTDTMGKLATAWGQAKDFVKWSVEANEWRAELDFSRAVKGVTPEELQALKEMDEAGRFVFTIGQDLGAAAEGRNTKTARFIRSINTPTHTTELINRVSTGLAAYRISRKNGNTPKGAIEFALRTVDNTQVNMDPVMGARNLKTLFGRQGTQPFAKIIFQFWKFQQGMAYTTLTTMKDALTHPDPALRKQARDSAIGLTVSLMATSGIFGLPFVGTGMMLLSFLASLDGDDDEDDDVERLVKNWIKESPLPNVVADTLNKGFLSAILPTDAAPYLAPRFGMGTLMNPLGYARFDDAERGEDVVKELMFRVLGGPTGSSAAAFWDGIQAGLDGDYAKATEKMVPLKLMRDLARTYTLADQGVSTGKGEERIDPNDMSVMSWIWQAMGVTPMKKAMYHEGQAGVQALKTAVTREREELLARHAQARLKGEDVSEITRNILRFNQKHPHARIKAENLRQAFSRRRDNQRKLTDTGILADRQNRPYLGNAAWTQ